MDRYFFENNRKKVFDKINQENVDWEKSEKIMKIIFILIKSTLMRIIINYIINITLSQYAFYILFYHLPLLTEVIFL